MQQHKDGAWGRTAPQLPYDAIHPLATDWQPDHVAIRFSNDLLTELDRFRVNGNEPNVLLLAALQAVLYRYAGQEIFHLRIRRTEPASDGAIACRIDAVTRSHQLVAATSVELQRLAGSEPNACREDQALPVMVSLSEVSLGKEEFARVGPSNLGSRTRYDLHLILAAPGPQAALFFNPARLQRSTVTRFIGHLNRLAVAMLRSPDAAIATLPMLGNAEHRQLLSDWRPPSHHRPFVPLHRLVEVQAANRPDAVAVQFREDSLTYRDLDRHADHLARLLVDCGVAGGAPVAICLEPEIDIASCILAIFKAGGAYVPLDPGYPTVRLGVLIDDIRPRALLTRKSLIPRLPALDCPCLCLDELLPYAHENPKAPVSVTPLADQPAFIVYTSGTTGKPKGVVLSHANLVHYVGSAVDRYGFGPNDAMPAIARFSFSISLFELLTPLVAGARSIVLERTQVLDPRQLLQVLAHATIVHASPSLWRKLLAFIAEADVPLRPARLRHVSSGGDIVSADLMEAIKRTFPHAERYVIYGCSEVACMAVTYPIAQRRKKETQETRSRIGKPFGNVCIRLYDGHGNLVPIGVTGEVHIGGAGVALGYLNRPELTRERFVTIDGERFYRTGDLARYDRDGNLEILGRNDFQIKLRGMRIEPGEVETSLRQAPDVRDAVVAGRALPNGTTALVAYVVMRDGSEMDSARLRQFLRERLPDYMVPAIYVALDALPVNVNLKVDRNALPPPRMEERAATGQRDAPDNETERRLLAIWERTLGMRGFGVEDAFFDLGGDSLLSISLMMEIEKAFGRILPLSAVLTDPTIRQQARLLDSATAGSTSLVPLREGGDAPPIFFVHDGEGEILPYRNLAFRLPAAHPVYALRPHGTSVHPILHTRLGEIADYYVRQIRAVREQGPYFVGGLCIGGFIAFEVARRLRDLGHEVGPVLLLDAAHVHALPKSITQRRLQSFSAAIPRTSGANPFRTIASAIPVVARKLSNLLRYEFKSRIDKAWKQLRFRAFRFCLDHRMPIPALLRHIDVDTVLRCAEREYEMPSRYAGELLLLRATASDRRFDGTPVDDTPYVQLFVDPKLGWEARAASLSVVDIPGGHSSMLQSPNVETLAGIIAARIDHAAPQDRNAHSALAA